MPYILPQEHGHHPDTRWLTLTDGAGFGLEVRGRPTIGFTASHFTAADLYAARHTCDLEPRAEVVLSLDHAQRGLGTASCGPDTAPRYRLLARATGSPTCCADRVAPREVRLVAEHPARLVDREEPHR